MTPNTNPLPPTGAWMGKQPQPPPTLCDLEYYYFKLNIKINVAQI